MGSFVYAGVTTWTFELSHLKETTGNGEEMPSQLKEPDPLGVEHLSVLENSLLRYIYQGKSVVTFLLRGRPYGFPKRGFCDRNSHLMAI